MRTQSRLVFYGRYQLYVFALPYNRFVVRQSGDDLALLIQYAARVPFNHFIWDTRKGEDRIVFTSPFLLNGVTAAKISTSNIQLTYFEKPFAWAHRIADGMKEQDRQLHLRAADTALDGLLKEDRSEGSWLRRFLRFIDPVPNAFNRPKVSSDKGGHNDLSSVNFSERPKGPRPMPRDRGNYR